MEHVFIIAARSELIESLKRFFHYSRGLEAQVYIRPSSGQGRQWVQQTFNRIADWMANTASQKSGEGSLRNSIALIELLDKDLRSLAELNPIAAEQIAPANPIAYGSRDWASVVAMLVLAFPEIHWVFLSRHEPFKSSFFTDSHFLGVENNLKRILELHDSGFMPLFDPTGLRNNVRTEARQRSDELEGGAYIPVREEVSAAIDEEEGYACFNAYAAFRFGFRSHAITSYSMMGKIFKENSNVPEESTPKLVFEDLYLKFPDTPDAAHLSDLVERDQSFPRLKLVKYRMFVTVGHQRAAYAERSNRNQVHLNNLKPQIWIKVRYKPCSGIFDLWKRSGLEQRLRADGNSWNLTKLTTQTSQDGHSAPGRLLVIAGHLINRSNAILRSADSVPSAVHGAVLALEAQELLGNRTPTTMLEALALKHQLEVLAECMFYGVEQNMDVKSRFDEIERDVKSVQEWFHPKKARLSALNAQIRIVNELSLIFREHNQFDEEQQCLTKLRELHRLLWFCKHAWWKWPLYPARWYIDFLLSSVPRFAFAIVFWIVVFGLLFMLFPHGDPSLSENPMMHGLVDSVTSFFGLQLPHGLEQLKRQGLVLISLAAILVGFIHLGILISHLYSIIARR
ncbi:MAG TPA: hypothetical protein VJM50_07195 [Pyrinomonadaceae bacterium]|nr:hypothetical protein [Pyrinomonadaceae bacterium]